MAELLGVGCSHGPIILTPPEVWHKGRERVFGRIPGYEPPAQLLKELGDDNGLAQDRLDQKKVVESFQVLHDRLHEWDPDVLMIIGDDQADFVFANGLIEHLTDPGIALAEFARVRHSGRGRPVPAEIWMHRQNPFSRSIRDGRRSKKKGLGSEGASFIFGGSGGFAVPAEKGARKNSHGCEFLRGN